MEKDGNFLRESESGKTQGDIDSGTPDLTSKGIRIHREGGTEIITPSPFMYLTGKPPPKFDSNPVLS